MTVSKPKMTELCLLSRFTNSSTTLLLDCKYIVTE